MHKLKPHFQPALKSARVRVTQHISIPTKRIQIKPREGCEKEPQLPGTDRLRKRKERDKGRVIPAQQTRQLQGLLNSPLYLVTSGAVVGRTCFMMVWIQLRRMPDVMADRVNSPSFV